MAARVFGETLPVSVEPLSPYGAVIRGVELTRPLTPAEVGELKSYLYQYHVLVFRGHQPPDDSQYLRFLQNFGTAVKDELSDDVGGPNRLRPDAPEVLMITSKIIEDGKEVGYVGEGPRGLGWHSDYCWADAVSEIGALEARVVTSHGGETCFADMYAVYDALEPDVRAKISTLTGVHELTLEGGDPIRHAEHPLVITNPYNGRHALYINNLYTKRLAGLPETEAQQLYDSLVDFSLSPRFVLEHTWQQDDLVVWDQIGLIHCRKPFDEREPRYMRQITLAVEDKNAPWTTAVPANA